MIGAKTAQKVESLVATDARQNGYTKDGKSCAFLIYLAGSKVARIVPAIRISANNVHQDFGTILY